jgi:hypothetical protein
MPNGIDLIKDGITRIEAGLEMTVKAASKEIKSLGTPQRKQYSDAVMDQNGFGSDTCEIYFYTYAPKGSPKPSLKPRASKRYERMINDPSKKEVYDKECFDGWKREIYAIQGVASVFGGRIEVENVPLEVYLKQLRESDWTPDHRVHVRVVVPGQDELRLARGLTACLRQYESATKKP